MVHPSCQGSAFCWLIIQPVLKTSAAYCSSLDRCTYLSWCSLALPLSGFLLTAVSPSPCTDLHGPLPVFLGPFLDLCEWVSAWSGWSVLLPQTGRRTWSPLPQITVNVYISLGVDIKFPFWLHTLSHGSSNTKASYLTKTLKGLRYFLCLLLLISLSVLIMSAILSLMGDTTHFLLKYLRACSSGPAVTFKQIFNCMYLTALKRLSWIMLYIKLCVPRLLFLFFIFIFFSILFYFYISCYMWI